MARKRVKPRPARGGTSGPKVLAQNRPKPKGYAARDALARVLSDDASPASARVFAARTLAEMDGAIGRLQVAPSNHAAAPLATLSRDQLVSELERLRALIDLGLVP